MKTAAYIADALRGMPGIRSADRYAKTGDQGSAEGRQAGPGRALRADMDALPVEERNDLPFRSQAKAI